MKTKYPCPECDEACYYHCTKNGQQEPECVTNNGWIKIESEADCPKKKGTYFLVTRKTGLITMQHRQPLTSKSTFERFSHYQPIQKPNPPVF